MRLKRRPITDLFEGLVFPVRLLGCMDENGAPGGTASAGAGSSPSASGSPAASSGSAASGASGVSGASSGVTPPGSSVAPGVEPPPGAPGSLADGGPSDGSQDFMSIFEGPQDPAPVFPGSNAADPAVTPPAAPAATPAAQPPAAAPAAPAAAPAAATPPAASGPGDGGQPPAATPPASGQSPALDPYDPVQLANHIQQNEAQITEFVAQSMFALSQEDLQALETDVAGTIPKLLAKGFVRSQQNLLMQLGRLVPQMIERTTSDLQNYSSNENAFYTRWKDSGIDRAKHGELVKRLGIMFRQANPKITRDQMIEELGPLVMMTAKIPLTQQPQAQPALGQPAPRPQHQPSPFTPAIPGPAAQSQQDELNPWEAMFVPQ